MSDWTSEQISRYQAAVSRAQRLTSYAELVRSCTDDCSVNAPSTEASISAAEREIGQRFPEELRQLYIETDGLTAIHGSGVVLPLSELITQNAFLRNDPGIKHLYMPFDHLLFFGSAGNGDLFCYPVQMDGTFKGDVFGWDHETDNRLWVASTLEDLLIRYSLGLLIDASS